MSRKTQKIKVSGKVRVTIKQEIPPPKLAERHPKVGIALIVHDGNGKVLLGTRKKKGPGDGKWQFPGGHLEMYETFEDCATRETREEAGIEVEDVFFLDLSNNPWPHHDCHYVTLFLVARLKSGTPTAMEPDKCDNWTWFDLDGMPPDDMLFESITILTPENKAKIRNRRGS